MADDEPQGTGKQHIPRLESQQPPFHLCVVPIAFSRAHLPVHSGGSIESAAAILGAILGLLAIPAMLAIS